MNNRQILLILLLTLAAAGCGAPTVSLYGSGSVSTEVREVGAFSALRMMAAGEAVITVGQPAGLTIEAEDNVLPALTTEVRDGVLMLGLQPNTSVATGEGWRYLITVQALDALVMDGSGEIVVTEMAGEYLQATISGSGSITLSGAVDRQTVVIDGPGAYHAFELASTAADVTVNGSGSAEIFASETLNATVNGSGEVIYAGSPTLTESIAGTGSVRPR